MNGYFSMAPGRTTGALLLALVTLACQGSGRTTLPAQRTQQVALEELPREIYADTITVQDFRRVCDALARDLVAQPFIGRSDAPPVVTIRKLANKTSVLIDEQIFQETIRVKLMEHSQGSVLFRDDDSYRDIVEERMRQSGSEIQVTLTDSVVSRNTNQRGRDLEFERGSLSGQGQHAIDSNVQDAERELELEQSASVKSRVAAADYFLRGLIYQVREADARNPKKGTSYFQYQFRVVDARSGIIVWEKMLDTKLAGSYAPVKKKAATSAQGGAPTNQFAGCVPIQGGQPVPQQPGAGGCPPGTVQSGAAPGQAQPGLGSK